MWLAGEKLPLVVCVIHLKQEAAPHSSCDGNSEVCRNKGSVRTRLEGLGSLWLTFSTYSESHGSLLSLSLGR